MVLRHGSRGLHEDNEADCTAAGATNVWSYEAVDGENAFIDGLNSHGAFAGLVSAPIFSAAIGFSASLAIMTFRNADVMLASVRQGRISRVDRRWRFVACCGSRWLFVW